MGLLKITITISTSPEWSFSDWSSLFPLMSKRLHFPEEPAITNRRPLENRFTISHVYLQITLSFVHYFTPTCRINTGRVYAFVLAFYHVV